MQQWCRNLQGAEKFLLLYYAHICSKNYMDMGSTNGVMNHIKISYPVPSKTKYRSITSHLYGDVTEYYVNVNNYIAIYNTHKDYFL